MGQKQRILEIILNVPTGMKQRLCEGETATAGCVGTILPVKRGQADLNRGTQVGDLMESGHPPLPHLPSKGHPLRGVPCLSDTRPRSPSTLPFSWMRVLSRPYPQ